MLVSCTEEQHLCPRNFKRSPLNWWFAAASAVLVALLDCAGEEGAEWGIISKPQEEMKDVSGSHCSSKLSFKSNKLISET